MTVCVSYAINVGELEPLSVLNQPFKARIHLGNPNNLSISSISVGVANDKMINRFKLKKEFLLQEVFFRMNVTDHGLYVDIYSTTVVREAAVQLLLQFNWPTGSVVRSYSVFLDPPTLKSADSKSGAGYRNQKSKSVSSYASTKKNRPHQKKKMAVNVDHVLAQPKQNRKSKQLAHTKTYYVQPQDTLWSIVNRFYPSSAYSKQQIMHALLLRNPEAFLDGDVHKLKKNIHLSLPASNQISTLMARTQPSSARPSLKNKNIQHLTNQVFKKKKEIPKVEHQHKVSQHTKPIDSHQALHDAAHHTEPNRKKTVHIAKKKENKQQITTASTHVEASQTVTAVPAKTSKPAAVAASVSNNKPAVIPEVLPPPPPPKAPKSALSLPSFAEFEEFSFLIYVFFGIVMLALFASMYRRHARQKADQADNDYAEDMSYVPEADVVASEVTDIQFDELVNEELEEDTLQDDLVAAETIEATVNEDDLVTAEAIEATVNEDVSFNLNEDSSAVAAESQQEDIAFGLAQETDDSEPQAEAEQPEAVADVEAEVEDDLAFDIGDAADEVTVQAEAKQQEADADVEVEDDLAFDIGGDAADEVTVQAEEEPPEAVADVETEVDDDLAFDIGGDAADEVTVQAEVEQPEAVADVEAEVEDDLAFDIGGDAADEVTVQAEAEQPEAVADVDNEADEGISFDLGDATEESETASTASAEISDLRGSQSEPDEEISFDLGSFDEAETTADALSSDKSIEFDAEKDVAENNLDTEQVVDHGAVNIDESVSFDLESEVQADTESSDELYVTSDDDAVDVKLDLAQAYIDMEQTEEAKVLVKEILTAANETQAKKANELLELLEK